MIRLFEVLFGDRRDALAWLYLACVIGILLVEEFWKVVVCVGLAIGTMLVRWLCPWTGAERTTVEG